MSSTFVCTHDRFFAFLNSLFVLSDFLCASPVRRMGLGVEQNNQVWNDAHSQSEKRGLQKVPIERLCIVVNGVMSPWR